MTTQREAEPFGIYHIGESEEESDFFLYKDSGDVACGNCVKLYSEKTVTELTASLAAMELEILRLRDAFIGLMRVVPMEVDCGNMHHKKADQHDYDETCPVVCRYAETLKARSRNDIPTSELLASVCQVVRWQDGVPRIHGTGQQSVRVRLPTWHVARYRAVPERN